MKITDKMRLDFVRQFGVGAMMNGKFNWPAYNCTKWCGKSFRQAIDDAIRATKPNRRGKPTTPCSNCGEFCYDTADACFIVPKPEPKDAEKR